MEPCSLRSRHSRAAVCYHPPGAVQIGVDHGPPALDGEVDGVLCELAAGIVDEMVEPAVLFEDAGEERPYGLRVADIADRRIQVEAAFPELRLQRVEPSPVPADDDHPCAEPGKQDRRRLAEPAAAARDQRRLACEQVRAIDRRPVEHALVMAVFRPAAGHALRRPRVRARPSPGHGNARAPVRCARR